MSTAFSLYGGHKSSTVTHFVQPRRLSPKDVDGNNTVNLRYVKFQNVQNIQLFIKDNQGGGDKTQLDRLVFIGAPITQTKMEDFKRISGKRGESH